MTQLHATPPGGQHGSSQHDPPPRGMSIGEYLIARMRQYKIDDVFGIPGDYILTFYGMLEKSPINIVGCTREDCAGFAADAYARVHGMGAVCVTYCVGGLSVCNSIAGAYAEKSPVLVISGSPGLAERVNNPLLHHKVRDFRTQIEVFEKLCVACAELTDPVVAFREIDRVLDAMARYKRPGYIEIPRDMVDVVPHISHAYHRARSDQDPQAADEAAEEAANLLTKAQRPVLIAGVEIHRFNLQDEVVALAEQMKVPMAATLLGKSVIPEKHPLYIGLYEGAMGRAEVTKLVEESDCVLLLGAFMTDLNLGIFTANLDPAKCIYATSETLRIRHHHYHGVGLKEFLDRLAARKPEPPVRAIPADIRAERKPFVLDPQAPLTTRRLISRLDEQLDDKSIVIADIGNSLFAATELTIHAKTEFISPAYYTSMGFSVPAALGALTARPESRVVVIVGDGAFQMTGMELSTIVRRHLSPLIIVLDNEGYGTERFLHEGEWEYNNVHPWKYSQLPNLLGGGTGYEVRTEGEFEAALIKAWEDRSAMTLIHAHIPRNEGSDALVRLAVKLSERVKGK
ncbi:Indole-3-pyruvate decarboxylase [Anatilimnocola aggregata]|uniref:Indole-3-pyruvate decarboxylase n=1 Tax=Anatilimnocola aggregata TaxID=2528021 RepID=A0A517YMK9_9BACT|nr:thiamine pyrophosphate-dependent enzyme [Anatilimnocola aggregata]QDU31446.1 Indole-3-pyruvate decarboxylase [Anatilimnocola aggregata]